MHLSKLKLNEDPKQEIAIEQLKCNKVTGANCIAPDVWKLGVPPLNIRLYELGICCWKQDLAQWMNTDQCL